MDPARRRRIEDVFDAALDRVAGERAAFVAVACGDDLALRQEVEALVAHAETARKAYDGFFALWSAADPTLQPLKEARAEYLRLRE